MEGYAQIMFSVEFIPGAMEWEGGRLDGKNQECGRTHLDFLSGAEVERAGRIGDRTMYKEAYPIELSFRHPFVLNLLECSGNISPE